MRHTRLMLVAVCAVSCNKAADAPKKEEPAADPLLNAKLVIVGDVPLRLAPSEDDTAPHPGGAPTVVNNMVGQLNRGKQGTARKVIPGWTYMSFDDGAEGWVRAAGVMPVSSYFEATVLEPTPGYRDATGEAALALVEPGTLLFVTERGSPRSRAQLENIGFVWVNTQELTNEDHHVGMSHMIIQAKTMRKMGDATEVQEVLDDARLEHPDSPLLQIIADQADAMKTTPEPVRGTSHAVQNYYNLP